jgi:glucuronate isomerase
MIKKTFIHDDFLLETKEAKELYHDYASSMPIVDYHCHLPVEEIAENKTWENITQIWLYGDHYKWRAMRSAAVQERFCTGDAADREKFNKWAEIMPLLLYNQLYNWTHLELARYFGINDKLLCQNTADEIWEITKSIINSPEFTCRKLLEQMKVKAVCTTDDPVDNLKYHKLIKKDAFFSVKVLPGWRPDEAMKIENIADFNQWVDKLSKSAGTEIKDFHAFLEALRIKHDYFHDNGCRVSDHGVETLYAEEYTQREIEKIFLKVRSKTPASEEEILKFKSAMLYKLAVLDGEKKWTQQFHYGVMRNNNTLIYKQVGKDAGCDSIGDFRSIGPLAKLLDRLNSKGLLTKTIIHNINPADNAKVATMLGNFQDDSIPCKMQQGSAWWFSDQRDGMEEQMRTLGNMSLLSKFVGMLTDSRSFLSFSRHEYFRRVLCNMLGTEMQKGFLPHDMKLIGSMVKDISYNNAVRYFGFGLEEE